MRLGVVIRRKNMYRLLAPVIDAALGRGWSVTCLHDVAQARGGFKGYEFPDLADVPRFREGAPAVEPYEGDGALPRALAAAGVEAVVSLVPPPGGHPPPGVPWGLLQYAGSLWRPLTPAELGAAHVVGVYTDWWLDFALQVHREHGTLVEPATEQAIRARAVAVGVPELDALAGLDRASLRARLGLPASGPVVVLLPYPFQSNPRTPWARWVYAPGPRWWRRARLRLAGAGALAPLVAEGADDRAVTRALRRFCDANGAWLVAKAREKDPVPPYVAAVADRVLYDERQYPATILELLAVADLCVHFYSAAIVEAAACGVPSLSICPEMDQMGTTTPWQHRLFRREPGTLFQSAGFASTMSVEEATGMLPRLRLSDVRPDGAALAEYVSRFVGPVDGKASGRFLDAVSRCRP
jgi:hypothetical protein